MTGSTVFDVIVIGAGHAGAAAARWLQKAGLQFLLLEKGATVGTSRASRYDSLVLTHSSRFAALPGLPFGPSSAFFPPRDEFVAYLERYFQTFSFPVVFNQNVKQIQKNNAGIFEIETTEGQCYHSKSIIAATGGCNQPSIPEIPGLATFPGMTLHSRQYSNPCGFTGKRIAIIGGGLSGLQIGYELSARADVHLITRKPIKRVPQYILGKEIVFRTHLLGIDASLLSPETAGVPDDGNYRKAIKTGRIAHHCRHRFTVEHTTILHEKKDLIEGVDVLLFATGYATTMPYLAGLPGVITQDCEPIQKKGISLADPTLCFLGIPGQNTFSSGNIRGASRDAQTIVAHLKNLLTPTSSATT